MKRNHCWQTLAFILVSILILPAARLSAAPPPLPSPRPAGETGSSQNTEQAAPAVNLVCELPFEFTETPFPSILAPSSLRRAPQLADIQVIYTGPWTTGAQTAFEFAVSLWEKLITSAVPIVIEAEWSNQLPSGALGGAGPATYHANFSNAPLNNTWYPVALANARAGVDLNGATPEIYSEFNSNFSWYVGTDGQTPFNQVDLATVVLHEIGHGLGFTGSARVINNMGYWGYNSSIPPYPLYPFPYDWYAENLSGFPVPSYPPPSSGLAQDLQSNNMYFDGPNARAFFGGSRVPLYAPLIWRPGSSYSHLNENFNGTDNDLMTFSVSNGTAIHYPGPITLGLLKDLGWTVQSAPYFDNLPTGLMEKNSSRNNALYLPAYVTDASPKEKITFAIVGSSTSNVTATTDAGKYLDLVAQNGWTGTAVITVRATNPTGLSSTKTYSVVVVNQLIRAFLPAVVR